jgi:hypothetical protein
LGWAWLGEADLSGASLRHTDFSNAHMPGAKLNGADLTETHFRGANLNGADVRTLALGSGRLIVTDLSRNKWLVSVQVKGMPADRATMVLARLSRPETWPEASFDTQVEATYRIRPWTRRWFGPRPWISLSQSRGSRPMSPTIRPSSRALSLEIAVIGLVPSSRTPVRLP